MHDEPVNIIVGVYSLENDEIRKLYEMHHLTVDRTLFLDRKVDLHVTRDAIKCMVRKWKRCQLTDSASSTHKPANIHGEKN